MFNAMADEVFVANRKKGFYEDSEKLTAVIEENAPELLPALRSLFIAQRIALIHSEVSEALESSRKDKFFNPKWLDLDWDAMDDENFKENFQNHVKDTFEDEIADTQIRTLDLAGYEKFSLDFHVRQKLRYNSLRPRKHGKEY